LRTNTYFAATTGSEPQLAEDELVKRLRAAGGGTDLHGIRLNYF
jgi:hypothetical protein